MHMTLFPSGRPKPTRTVTFTPSKGPFKSWVWIRDRYYVRLLGGGLTALSPEYSNLLRQKLEHRNRTLRHLKVSATVVAIALAGVAALAGWAR